MRVGLFVVVAACAIASAPRAQAGDHLDVGASFLCASQNASARSGGMVGGSVDVVRWFGRLGVEAEAGLHDWDPQGGARWVGGSVRLAILDGHVRNPASGAYAGGRLWLDAGVLEKWWHIGSFEGTPQQIDVYYDGPHEWLGFGVDLDALDARQRVNLGFSMWFRVERGHAPDLGAAPPASDATDFPPPATQLVFGFGAYFGGPV